MWRPGTCRRTCRLTQTHSPNCLSADTHLGLQRLQSKLSLVPEVKSVELKHVERPLCVCAMSGRSHCNATVTPGSLRMERWACGIGASDVPTTLMKFLVSQVSSTLTVGLLSSALLSSKHKFIRTISAGICPLPHYDVNLNCLFFYKKK